MKRQTLIGLALGAVWLAGCGGRAADPSQPPAAVKSDIGSRFDPSTAGEVRGRVAWDGDIPDIPDLQAAIPTGQQAYRWTVVPAPHKPVIDAQSKGLTGVAVYLRNVDPAKARPWDRGPVTVLQQDYRIRVVQTHPASNAPVFNVGFVRRGDEVTFTSGDPSQHMLRARGAAFFTLPFPEPGQPLTRRLDTPGVVELSSGAGMAWMAADLFVVEHPYYAVTDSDGRFTLPKVPPGEYDLVCRVRSWYVVDQDRDTETGLTIRHRYAPPVEKVGRVTVAPSGAATHGFTFALGDFPVPKP